jgi:hypothetical protein
MLGRASGMDGFLSEKRYLLHDQDPRFIAILVWAKVGDARPWLTCLCP